MKRARFMVPNCRLDCFIEWPFFEQFLAGYEYVLVIVEENTWPLQTKLRRLWVQFRPFLPPRLQNFNTEKGYGCCLC